jgi:hypothetical protein
MYGTQRHPLPTWMDKRIQMGEQRAADLPTPTQIFAQYILVLGK